MVFYFTYVKQHITAYISYKYRIHFLQNVENTVKFIRMKVAKNEKKKFESCL